RPSQALTGAGVSESRAAIYLHASCFTATNSSSATVAPPATCTLSLHVALPICPFAFALVSGAGGTDNAAFTIDGSHLNINGSANYGTKASYNTSHQIT